MTESKNEYIRADLSIPSLVAVFLVILTLIYFHLSFLTNENPENDYEQLGILMSSIFMSFVIVMLFVVLGGYTVFQSLENVSIPIKVYDVVLRIKRYFSTSLKGLFSVIAITLILPIYVPGLCLCIISLPFYLIGTVSKPWYRPLLFPLEIIERIGGNL